MRRDLSSDALLEDALEVLDVVLRDRLVLAAGEEAGGRQLLGVADDHRLPAARERSHRVPHGDLRGLVEDHEIEGRVVGLEVLGHRHRAHQEARLQLHGDLAELLDEPADRDVPRLLRELPLEQREPRQPAAAAARGGLQLTRGRPLRAEPRADLLGGRGETLLVELAVALDGAAVVHAVEGLQAVVGGDLVEQEARLEGAVEGAARAARGERAGLDGRDHRMEPDVHGGAAR